MISDFIGVSYPVSAVTTTINSVAVVTILPRISLLWELPINANRFYKQTTELPLRGFWFMTYRDVYTYQVVISLVQIRRSNPLQPTSYCD